MKAVVLAAGLGKRLATITVDKPKVLVKIGEKTLIEHNIEKLRRLGISQIALVIGYKGGMIKEVLGDTVTYYQQKEQLGTAHAFLCAEDFIADSFFLGMNGDVFFTDPLIDFIALEPPALAVYHVEDPRRYGRMEIRDGKLISVREKVEDETPGYANPGIYLFPSEAFDFIRKTPLSSRKEFEITDTIQMLIDKGWRFTAYELRGFWTDITYTSDIEKARLVVDKMRTEQERKRVRGFSDS